MVSASNSRERPVILPKGSASVARVQTCSEVFLLRMCTAARFEVVPRDIMRYLGCSEDEMKEFHIWHSDLVCLEDFGQDVAGEVVCGKGFIGMSV